MRAAGAASFWFPKPGTTVVEVPADKIHLASFLHAEVNDATHSRWSGHAFVRELVVHVEAQQRDKRKPQAWVVLCKRHPREGPPDLEQFLQ